MASERPRKDKVGSAGAARRVRRPGRALYGASEVAETLGLFEGDFVGTLVSLSSGLNLYLHSGRAAACPPEGAVLSSRGVRSQPPLQGPRVFWRVISPSATSLMDAVALNCPSLILHLRADELNPF